MSSQMHSKSIKTLTSAQQFLDFYKKTHYLQRDLITDTNN